MDILEKLKTKIANRHIKIVFSDGHSEKTAEAVKILKNEHLADPVVVFNGKKYPEAMSKYPRDIQTVDCSDEAQACYWIELFRTKDDSHTETNLRRKFKRPLDAATIILGADGADAMVAGLTDTTEDVILSAFYLIGVQEGVSPSSFFLLNIPPDEQNDNEFYAFADCALITTPNSEELADIAIMTAKNTAAILGWTPRVAMLSFSTKGSAEHETVDKVRAAVEIARAKAPDIAVDGEFQADAALDPEVARCKIEGGSEVAGKANILIFPDVNAGNIGYKLVRHFAKADAYGPIFQGFGKNITDLSRGATVEDIVGSAIIIAAGLQRENPAQ